MSSGGRGQCAASTGSEDEGRGVELGKRKRKPRIKKHIQEKKFVIHPDNLCGTTSSELYQAQTNTNERTSIPIDDSKSEREIRDILVENLPKLQGQRFQFFTKVKAKNHFCPCSPICEDAAHAENPISEWNGKNVKKMTRGNRVVYILCLCKETAMTEGQEDEVSSFGSTQAEHVLTPNVTPGSTNTSRTAREQLLPQTASRDNITEEEITSLVDTINLLDQSQNIRRIDDNDNDEKDVDDANDDYDDGESEEEEESLPPPPPPTQQMLTDVKTLDENPSMSNPENVSNRGGASGITATENRIDPDSTYITLTTGSNTSLFSLGSAHQTQWNNYVASTSNNVSSESSFESTSGYDTIRTIPAPVELAHSVQDEELQTLFLDYSPLLDINLNGTSLLPAPTEFMPIFQEFHGTPPEIKEIVPDNGNVAGGMTFYLSLAKACAIHDVQVQFGPSIIPVERRGDEDFKGIVPPYPEADVVQVYLVNNWLKKISNSKPFEYTDPAKTDEDWVKKKMKSTKDIKDHLFVLSKQLGEIISKSEEAKDSQGTNQPGGGKTQALSLLYMIAKTAAMSNAIDFYRIIFNTQVGHTVFKSCKDAQTPLEEIARENGHEQLARLLEQKHSMYQDDENESDDEVDWEELARAIQKYQALKGETAEIKRIPSTSSSEQTHGYLGDGESSTSLSSLHLLDVEGCTEPAEGCLESTFEEQQTTPESKCEEEPDTCQIIVAEGCPENTLEDRQNIPKSRCREKPDTCQTSGKIAIRNGMSDTDIINKILSSYQLRMNKARHIKESQSSIGEKNELANLHVNPLHSVASCPIIMKSYQMDKFAPKEVSSLRRKLGSSDAAKMNPSALYPDKDQAIYNLIGRKDTHPEVDFLEKLKQDSTGGLKAQKRCKHQKTAEKEICDAKRKGAAVIKTESITCLYSPLQSKVESGVEIAALAGSASNSSLEEQSTEEEISQDARFFDERSASNISLEEQSTEEEITQDARFFDERKSACLWFLKTRRLAYAVLLTSLLIVVVCLVTIFTSRASTKKQTPSTWVETMTTSRQACSNGLLTLSCEGVTNVNAVHKVRWKIKFPEAGWKEFSYCGRSGMSCVVTRPELPEGIKVLKVSNRSVNLQRVAKNNTNGYAQTMCQVLYSDNSRTSHVHKINFTAKCVRIHEHSDLNLTKILQSLVRCERAVDIEWYSIDGNKFAYCNTCQDCKKLSEVNREHVFWNRLQVTRDSLLLSAIQESDDGRTIKVKVHMEASGKSAGRDVEASMESAHMYTIWIFVNTSRPPVVNCSVLSVGHLVKTSPHSCVTSQMKFNTTCSFSCPHGYQLQGPSYKQCGANGQWTDNAKSVSCQDVNECTASNGGCSHKCVNTGGDYKCECPDPELSLASDNKTCHVVNCSVLSVGHLVKTSPDSCVTSQMKFNTTCSFSCPHGYQLQGPSYKQCRTNGQWTDSAKSVSCQDVNECTASNGGCSDKCVNTAGGYKCECPDPELSLAPDNKTCHVPEKENKSLFGSPVKMAAVDDCQEMQYWNGTSCIPCSGCPRGFGLKTKCQSKRDTECVACYPGYDYSNTTGFELCIPCDRYSNCLPGRSKKIKECTIFSGPVCDGCEDGNYFNPTLGGCVKCSFPCSILQEEIRSCTTDHDRKCKAKRTVTPPGDSPTSPATEVPSAGLDWRVDLEPPLVQNGGLWGGVAGGFVLLVIAIAVTIIKSKSRNRRKRHATAENDGQLRNPLMLNLDQSISNLTIKGRRFITRRLNGKCYDGYFYWEICAHKLGYQTECESWKYAENPAEKFLTAYGEKAGSTIKKLVDVLRDPEVDLTQIADEIERELFLLSYEVDNVEETEI